MSRDTGSRTTSRNFEAARSAAVIKPKSIRGASPARIFAGVPSTKQRDLHVSRRKTEVNLSLVSPEESVNMCVSL
eukprot:scaffold43455_cov118-Phaeocystis_antarctica.AAC.1